MAGREQRSDAANLLAIGASAGSGKTQRLTDEVIGAVDPSGPAPVPLDGLVAVTYTRKAAAELTSRVRRRLVGQATALSSELELALIGTIHAVCLRLLKEFALDAGISPAVDVLPEDDGRFLREVLENEVPIEMHERMTNLASHLQIRWDGRVRRHDWIAPVADIMTLARSNRIEPRDLDLMAARSWADYLALLPPDVCDGAVLDADLDRELRTALPELERVNDGQENTGKVLDQLRSIIRNLPVSGLPWSDWAKLSRLVPGKACRPAVAKLVETAGQYERHPRLREELREFLEGTFKVARVGLERFAEWKATRRVVDYVDMVDIALHLVELPSVGAELESRLRLVVVDEFQDTSPIQLALFTRLHRLAGRSVWVGDRKQCIFEYAGADPALMDAVLRWCSVSGGRTDQLPSNYRSRRELVDVVSMLFGSAFGRHDIDPSEVVVTAQRKTPTTVGVVPPLGLWLIEARQAKEEAQAIANGVAKLLARPGDTMVLDRETLEARPVRAGDVSILVATNDDALEIADALEEVDVHVALPRHGLLGTPEGVLVTSALEYLHDRSADLALANMEALLGFDGLPRERWLEELLSRSAPPRRPDSIDAEEHASGRQRAPGEASVAIAALDEMRASANALAPTEIVEVALAKLDIARLCARWPNSTQRIGNVDAIRGLAKKYEQRCHHENEAASLAGLVRYFRVVSRPSLRGNEFRATDDQYVQSGDAAVTVCTYHRAKGLEWPVVVLSSLNRSARRTPFDVYPESEQPTFNPDAPLEGRRIRYWPWPFGSQKDLPLASIAAQSPEGKRVAENESKERMRLLYVGFTRARDHLILAARCGKDGPRIEWLNELVDSNGRGLLQLPWEAGGGHLIGIRRPAEESLTVPTRVWRLASTREDEIASPAESLKWFSRSPITEMPPPYWIAPSRAAAEWPECGQADIGEIVRLGDGVAAGLSLPAEEWARLGTAVHGFLACDGGERDLAEERRARAKRLLEAANLSVQVQAERLLDASDLLRSFISARWPAGNIMPEVPITGVLPGAPGQRCIRGSVDLLVESQSGLVIIDHKTFPGVGEAVWKRRAEENAPQVLAYAEVLKMVPGTTVVGLWIHFVLSGAMVEILPRTDKVDLR